MTAVWVWLAGAASYMVLAGQVSLDEAGTAVILGALGAAWHSALTHDGAQRFAFERPALGALASALRSLPGATLGVGVRLAVALLQPVEGRRIAQPFHRGGNDDPRDRGRRAVVVLAASLTPDSFVLTLPRDEDTITFHAFTSASPGGDPRWPA